jgi:hypothetical protein
MNPDMWFYIHHHYGTGYMSNPYYGTYIGYPSCEILPLNDPPINDKWGDYELIYYKPNSQHPFVPFTGP